MNNQILDENGNIVIQESSQTKTKIQKSSSTRKTVFEFDCNELYELLINHGISSKTSDILLSKS